MDIHEVVFEVNGCNYWCEFFSSARNKINILYEEIKFHITQTSSTDILEDNPLAPS